jgi:hypothetical protein
MSNIFSVTSTSSVGCTFLDWSIHWLSGEQQFYNVNSKWGSLTDNPITNKNAHLHNKNHPSGYAETTNYIKKLKEVSSDSTLSIYFFPLRTHYATATLNITPETLGESLDVIVDLQNIDYAKIWSYCNSETIPIIYVNLTSPILYTNEIRVLNHKTFINTVRNSIDEVRSDFLLDYFSKDLHILKDQGNFDHIWDQREFIALNIRPWDTQNMGQDVDFSIPHLYLDAQELWHNGEQTLIKVMQYLNIPIDNDRLIHWRPIYKTWQDMQVSILKFAWNFDYICESIVNGYNYNISDYNLDLWKEAMIQHTILYKYGLNFKTWQLEKFPNNTKELHKLLEPNIHNIEDIYGSLKDNK